MARSPMFIVTQVAPYPDGPSGVHGVLTQASTALGELAAMVGLEPVVVSDVADLSPAELSNGGVLSLFTIGETPWSDSQRSAITDSLRQGRLSVVGVHSATDACRGWEGYATLVGARFDGHPWTQEFEVEIADRVHPATAHLTSPWRWHDEVYLFRDLRPDAHILLRVAHGQLDMSLPEARVPECGFPLAWCFTEGQGRSFYTSLGHFPGAWENPTFMRHVGGGLAWALGET
ncbi:MAG TPA: ThuA domain-containing protein [Acidimicrobiales bacterium]|nr:ThuA domain-containing protein [Acidimicrobiales bacterium]